MIEICVLSGAGEALSRVRSDGEVSLYHSRPYAPGDRIQIASDEGRYFAIQVDHAVECASVYAPSGRMTYRIPVGDELFAYAPGAFAGERHVIRVRTLSVAEIAARRNLALNPADQRGESDFFPHATANAETRGEAVFAARNTIDGYVLNSSHGEWPFQSWGIGAREDAWLRLDFGRVVVLDELRLTLRADFPHDAYWTCAAVELSDGFSRTFPLMRTHRPQPVPLDGHRAEWLILKDLIKSDDPSAFPALTEIEAYGTEEVE